MAKMILNQKYEKFIIWLSYFSILSLIAIFVRDIAGQPNSFVSIEEIMSSSSLGDPVSFLTAAIDIAKHGWVSPENAWILNLWPPGFILLQSSLIKLFGIDAPILLFLQLIASCLFAYVLLEFFYFSSRILKGNRLFSFTVPLVIFCFPVARVFLLQPTGVSLGESFAISFFLLAFFQLFKEPRKCLWGHSIISGLFLALSAYFRSQFEFIVLMLSAWLLVFYLFSKIGLIKKISQKSNLTFYKNMLIALTVAHVLMLPWRTYHYVEQGMPAWVSTILVTMDNSVMTTSYLKEHHGEFVVEGGGNLVCRIDKTTCGDREHARKLFFKTLLTNPIAWYKVKLGIVGKYWFSSIENWSAATIRPKLADYLFNSIILFMLIGSIAHLFLGSEWCKDNKLIFIYIYATFFSAYFIIFTIQQYEVRYFYFPKIMIIVMSLLQISMFKSNHKCRC